MKRYDGLRVIASAIKDELVVVSLGDITTEWHSLRPGGGSLYLQALGSVTPVAMGIALELVQPGMLCFISLSSFSREVRREAGLQHV
ncbi:MAG: hypothetical protein V3S39_02760, partial [Thermodesulfobacteriota bacterium]